MWERDGRISASDLPDMLSAIFFAQGLALPGKSLAVLLSRGAINVIARSGSDEAIQNLVVSRLDCFARNGVSISKPSTPARLPHAS
jgi:hypothetical protein